MHDTKKERDPDRAATSRNTFAKVLWLFFATAVLAPALTGVLVAVFFAATESGSDIASMPIDRTLESFLVYAVVGAITGIRMGLVPVAVIVVPVILWRRRVGKPLHVFALVMLAVTTATASPVLADILGDLSRGRSVWPLFWNIFLLYIAFASFLVFSLMLSLRKLLRLDGYVSP